MREAVGPEARIRVDANAAWDVDAARRTLRELEELDVELAEQPVATLEEAAEVAAATSIPLAGDESVESRADAERAVALGACDFAGVKLTKVGGPEEAIAVAEVLPSYLSSALDGPVGIAAAAQVAQTLRQNARGGRGRPRPRARDPAPLLLDRGRGRVRAARRDAAPARPGPASASRSTSARSTTTGFRPSLMT